MGVTKFITDKGDGPSPKIHDKVSVEYAGWLWDGAEFEKGKEFDSSAGRGPFTTIIGTGKVIKGWDEVVLTMKVGEKAKVYITSDYAYGKNEFPGFIPPNSDLAFEIELKAIKSVETESQKNEAQKNEAQKNEAQKNEAHETEIGLNPLENLMADIKLDRKDKELM